MLIPQFQPLVNLNLEASGSFLIRPGSDEVAAAGSRAGGGVGFARTREKPKRLQSQERREKKEESSQREEPRAAVRKEEERTKVKVKVAELLRSHSVDSENQFEVRT